MRYLLMVCLLLACAACSGDAPGRANLADNGAADTTSANDATSGFAQDAARPDASDDTRRESPDFDSLGPELPGACVCADVGPCCDGCQPINLGEACDDGLECTLETTCQPDGTCGGAAGSPCDAQLSEPQCQAVTCDEFRGCSSVQNVREGFACDDGDPRTLDDKCQRGACVGTPCECAGESACCDGCFAINDGAACDDGDPRTFDDACSGGACAGTACECSEGECCDGCRFLPDDVVCESLGHQRVTCSSPDVCGNFVVLQEYQSRCTGRSAQCGASDWHVVEVFRQCEGFQKCYKYPEISPKCGWSPDCN